MRQVAAPGRWIWGLSGLVTIAALAIPGVRVITYAGVSPAMGVEPQTIVTRTRRTCPAVTRTDAPS